LESAGLRPAESTGAPDIWFINTCTVTHVADRKARQTIRRKIRETPGARIFVTGCYAASRKKDLRRIRGISGVYERKEWDAMIKNIGRVENISANSDQDNDFGVHNFFGRSRAFVKIQDGCDSFCSYCVVPHVRGRPRSRELDDALEEGRRMIDAGFRELVLTGIHLGLYGADLPEQVELADAVEAFANLDTDVRVRLSSLEGPEVGQRLLEAMARPGVCAHLHLPLQSGDEHVLKAMGRRYGPEKFRQVVDRIRDTLHEPAISTDIMVGFPGESEQAFSNTLEFCENVGFSRIHVFNYSPRPGTAAYDMRPRTDPRVAARRSKRLRKLDARLQAEWARKFIGREIRVLCEKAEPDGWMYGYSDRYVRIKTPAEEGLRGQLHRAVGAKTDGCELIVSLNGG